MLIRTYLGNVKDGVEVNSSLVKLVLKARLEEYSLTMSVRCPMRLPSPVTSAETLMHGSLKQFNCPAGPADLL